MRVAVLWATVPGHLLDEAGLQVSVDGVVAVQPLHAELAVLREVRQPANQRANGAVERLVVGPGALCDIPRTVARKIFFFVGPKPCP